MTSKSEIAARCADEIMALQRFGELDKFTLEQIIMTYMLEVEQATSARDLENLGKAFRERAEG